MFQVTTALPEPGKPISELKCFEYVGQAQEEEKSAEPVKFVKKTKAQKKAEAEAEPVPEPVKEMIPLEQRKVNYK